MARTRTIRLTVTEAAWLLALVAGEAQYSALGEGPMEEQRNEIARSVLAVLRRADEIGR